MKNPKSKFVSNFNRAQKKRQTRNLIILSIAAFLALFVILVLYMSALKNQFDKSFPSSDVTTLASSVTTQPESHALTSESTGTSVTESPTTNPTESTTIETTPGDSTDTSSGSTGTSETQKSEAPLDVVIPEGNTLFPETEFIQKINHNERDIAFSELKKDVKQYIESQSGSRIGVYTINLSSKEEFGYNDFSPFVVGSTFNLPINLMLYDAIANSTVLPDEFITYTSDYNTDAYSLLSGTKTGVHYSLRQLTYLSMSQSDAIATSMLLNRLGGIDNLNPKLLEISKIIDFTQVQTYKDYRKIVMKGSQRSCAYDMSNFAEEVYYRYMRNPDIYQNMINDWNNSDNASVIKETFGTDTLTLSKMGINQQYDAYAEVALVIAQEPVIICILIETPNQTHADTITRDLSSLYKNYIDYCYS